MRNRWTRTKRQGEALLLSLCLYVSARAKKRTTRQRGKIKITPLRLDFIELSVAGAPTSQLLFRPDEIYTLLCVFAIFSINRRQFRDI